MGEKSNLLRGAMMFNDGLTNIEKGEIYFFYRQYIGEEFPESANDIQHYYMVLNPDDMHVYRLVLMGRKKTAGRKRAFERVWGSVIRVAETADHIDAEMHPKRYENKSREERRLKAPRLCGNGVYHIIGHGDHTHLAYSIEVPAEQDEITSQFAVEQEASYILQVRNPEMPSPMVLGVENAFCPAYPRRLGELFGQRRFIGAEEREVLDYEGTGVVMTRGYGQQMIGEPEIEPEVEEAIDEQLISAIRQEAEHLVGCG